MPNPPPDLPPAVPDPPSRTQWWTPIGELGRDLRVGDVGLFTEEDRRSWHLAVIVALPGEASGDITVASRFGPPSTYPPAALTAVATDRLAPPPASLVFTGLPVPGSVPTGIVWTAAQERNEVRVPESMTIGDRALLGALCDAVSAALAQPPEET